MNKVIIASTAVLAFAFLGMNPSPAPARGFGIQVSGSGYHVDFGDVHHGHGHHYGHHGGNYGGYYLRERGGYGDHVWHDTSHYDYHPAEVVRHRRHYHYVPEHYDFHESGHWDHYHW